MEIPSRDDNRTLRVVQIDNFKIEPYAKRYVLHTWDTYKRDGRGAFGRCWIGYAFYREGELEPLFVGDDFSPPPSQSIDSDESLRSLLGFLTLRPGDTDSEYFEKYTDAQRAFAESEAEDLSFWGLDVESWHEGGDQPPAFLDIE